MKSKTIKIIIDVILVALTMLMIFHFSSEKASKSDVTSLETSKKIISIVYPDNEEKVEQIAVKDFTTIRKLAHITEFALLGFLLLNLFKDWRNTINYKIIIICIIIALVYASFDEIHQLFVDGRSGSVIDTLIDTIGAVFGISIYYVLYKLRKRSKYSI